MNSFGHHRKLHTPISFDFPLIYFSCVIVNFCLSSGLGALTVFVTFLCGILASAFYKYTIHREHTLIETEVTHLSSKIENTEEDEEEIHHLLNDDDLTTTDFLEQLKMYGVQIDDNLEFELL